MAGSCSSRCAAKGFKGKDVIVEGTQNLQLDMVENPKTGSVSKFWTAIRNVKNIGMMGFGYDDRIDIGQNLFEIGIRNTKVNFLI